MNLYRLRSVLRKPSDETEGKYLAEIPDLPGCRAWGDTAAQALESLQSVATAFIESYRERGDPLPPQVAAAVVDAGEHQGSVKSWSRFEIRRIHTQAASTRMRPG